MILIRFDSNFEHHIQSDPAAVMVDDADHETITQRSHSDYLNIPKHYSNDLLIDEDLYQMQNQLLTISEYLILALLYALNSLAYICLPFAFIMAVSVRA